MLEEGDLPKDPPAHLTFEKACEVMKALVLAPQQEQVRVMKEGADDMDSFIVSVDKEADAWRLLTFWQPAIVSSGCCFVSKDPASV